MSKIMLQDAAEELRLADDPLLEPELFDAFPKPMRKAHAEAIRAHRLRHEIVATKVANRLVNRLGPSVAFDLTEEEGASLQQVVIAFLVAERLLDLDKLWAGDRGGRAARGGPHRAVRDRRGSIRAHISDILRSIGRETQRQPDVQAARAAAPARFPPPRPSSSAPKSATRPRRAATG